MGAKARRELRNKKIKFAMELRRDDQKQAQLQKKVESQRAKTTSAINSEKAREAMEFKKWSAILAKAHTAAVTEATRLSRKLSEEIARKTMMYNREQAQVAQKKK